MQEFTIKMKIKIVLSSSLLLLSSGAYALDLVEAYQRAQSTDPNWQAKLLQYEAEQLDLGIAKGNLLPTITLSGNVTRKSQQTNSNLDTDLPFNLDGGLKIEVQQRCVIE